VAAAAVWWNDGGQMKQVDKNYPSAQQDPQRQVDVPVNVLL